MTATAPHLRRLALAAGLIAALVSGCDRSAPTSSAPRDAPLRPTVVSMVPNVTELVFAMGQGRHLVGRSRFCNHPPEAAALPILGDVRDVNVEKMIALAPDLAVFNTANAAGYTRLTDAGIRCISPRMETIEEVYQVAELLGRELNAENDAARLVVRLQTDLDAVRRAAQGAPRVRTLVTFPDTVGSGGELLVVGRETFVDELLTLAGGTNVADVKGYPRVSIETLARWAPDVILISETGDVSPGGADEVYRRPWARWDSIPAVRDGRIIVLRQPYLTIPGPRMADAARLLLATLHPDRQIAG